MTWNDFTCRLRVQSLVETTDSSLAEVIYRQSYSCNKVVEI